jgi:S1-C subfamily serine protease
VRRVLVAAALAAGLATAAPAAAAAPDALAGDPLDRAAAMALPAVYRLESEVEVEGLVSRLGNPIELSDAARIVTEVGTAFGVGEGGHLVAAAHVTFPDGEDLAVSALLTRDAERGVERTRAEVRSWVEAHGVRPTGARLVALVARQADAGYGGGRGYPARITRVDRGSDLALIRLRGAPGAPVLPLATSASAGTPVIAIGFGTGARFTAAAHEAPVPGRRKGILGSSFQSTGPLVPGKVVTRLIPIAHDGDSGGPAVDEDGRVRGVVLGNKDRFAFIMRSKEVVRLLTEAGVGSRPRPVDRAYRRGLEQLWALDFSAARASFAAAAAAFPEHTLARPLRLRAAELASADFEIAGRRRPQGFLLALGIVSAIAALACALALVGPALARVFRSDR